MSTKLEDLEPEARELAIAFVSSLEDAGIEYAVTSTLRTVDEQIALYSQGRAPLDIVNLLRKKAGMLFISAAENTYTVTKCDGIMKKSNHQGGKALDVVPLVNGKPTWDCNKYTSKFVTIGTVGKSVGLRWGGDWPPVDTVTKLGWDVGHFEV